MITELLAKEFANPAHYSLVMKGTAINMNMKFRRSKYRSLTSKSFSPIQNGSFHQNGSCATKGPAKAANEMV